MVIGYDARWSEAEWRLDGEPEQTVQLPIINPETGRTSRTFTQAGKFDGTVYGYGKRLLLEHKSTGDDIADPNSTYWRRLAIDSQVSKYMLQSWQLGEKLDGALYDVIRKPAIRPKKLSRAEGLAAIGGAYCGFDVDPETSDAVARGMERESPDLFALRVASETLAEPERYFQRRTIPRLDGDVLEYAAELWTIADEIRIARNSGRNFRNSAACLDYGRPCEYLGICSGYDSEESDNWTRADDVHAELDGIVGGGRNVLTNSRIKCFQTCRRRHYYRYELGLRRIAEDEPEALYLGSLLHEALASWWKALSKGEWNGAPSYGSAATEVAEPAAAR